MKMSIRINVHVAVVQNDKNTTPGEANSLGYFVA